jgi:hypothetical protein
LDLFRDTVGLASEQCFIEADELKEGSGGGVIVTTALEQEVLVCITDGQVNEGHMAGKVVGDLLGGECNILEELLGDTDKRILGPLMEPIDGSAVD